MAQNKGLFQLDISKNKDLTDEDSLVTLSDALSKNKSLKILDLSGITVRKPFLKQHFMKAMQQNITLQVIIGKLPQGIINAELE